MVIVRDKIVEMRKQDKGLNAILQEVMKYDPFINLDEMLNLSFILDTLIQNEFKVNKKEVRGVFDKHYSKEYHGEKTSYMKFLENKVE